MMRGGILWSVILLGLCGCDTRSGLAPVTELNWKATGSAKKHVVLHGETLYAIAFRYDQDYRKLAAVNQLRPPYTLRVGQVLRLRQEARPVKSRGAFKQGVLIDSPLWLWPLKGRVVHSFMPDQGMKGIDIAGRSGDKIKAAAGGVVAYAGNGLSGYGNLILIKHARGYMTAYGHNFRNVVREGQIIQAGQTIADIGLIERRFWGVHFEIRTLGKPVNPLSYLK